VTDLSVLTRWVRLVCCWPRVTLSALLFVTVGMAWYGAANFKINSDLNKLIDQTSDWRVDFDAFERQFPDLVHTAVVVVSATSQKNLETVTAEIVTYLRRHDELFTAVAAPGSEAFYRDHAFLYMDIDQLDKVTDRLAQAQPLINAIHRDPTMQGVADLLVRGYDTVFDKEESLEVILARLSDSAANAVAQNFTPVNWTDEFFPLSERRYQLVYLKPQSNFAQSLPDAAVVAGLREMVAIIEKPGDVEIQLTGEITLQHEEIEAAVSGVSVAGWLALGLLLLVLIAGVRSGKIIAATFLMLFIGILWTTAYAMATVGAFNTLSLVFIVMFFGLGVDFSLHFCLRFQEAINQGKTEVQQGLLESTASVGRAISLCSLTTAIGFLGFWPTAYQGLADLGVISAGGMVIAWFLTFTFLPAFFSVVGAPRAHQMDLPTSQGIVRGLLRHRMLVVLGVVGIGVLASSLAIRSQFDYSVLALKDPSSESMLALRELQRNQLATDYQLVVLDKTAIAASDLQTLPSVASVGGYQDLLPHDIDEKAQAVEDLSIMFWELNNDESTEDSIETSPRQALKEIVDAARRGGADMGMVENLDALLSEPDEVLARWEVGFLENLLQELQWLRRAINTFDVSAEDIPDASRFVSSEGARLYTVTPARDIAEVSELSTFIDEVKSIHPHATGRPVIEWGVGNIVVTAFQQAMLFALVGIVTVLLVTLRRIGPTLLVLAPLVLASVCTFALGFLLGESVNMASVLVLPLVFGLGVDNGIHVVDRYLIDSAGDSEGDSEGDGAKDVDHLIHSSTPRAVVLSALTTIGAFAALAISPHQGTASIGLLLSVSVGFLLVFTVFILPVLLSFLSRGKA
jgi:hopanoid biosynthesis associated RND transporter like protein HpnN